MVTADGSVRSSFGSRLSVAAAARGSALVVVLMSVGLVAGVAVTATPASSAARAWSIVKSPPNTGGSLRAVSCPGPQSCFGVGARSLQPQTVEPLIERWNGHVWSVMPSPKLDPDFQGVRFADLDGLACPSSTSCFAVGHNVRKTLVEHWNGHDWSIMKSPTPPVQLNAEVELRGIACPGTNSCFAVGLVGSGDYSTSLVEHWNGHDWSIMKMPIHSPRNDYLSAVSCPRRTSCFAVGASQRRAVVDHWNGITWGDMATPTTARGSGLSGVSCPDPKLCVAVGSSAVPSGSKTLMERWNGHDWAPMKSSDQHIMFAVKCPNTNLCIAVGGRSGTLAERWVPGQSWTLMKTPPTPSFSQLSGIGCSNTNGCFAVGYEYLGPNRSASLIEHYG